MYTRQKMFLCSCTVLLLLSAVDNVAAGGEYVWTSNGPYGGAIAALAIDPNTPTTVYAGTHFGGIFKSTNGGSSWFPLNQAPGVVNTISIDQANSNTIYAGGDGSIFKSTDGGLTWSHTADIINKAVTCLTIDPNNSQRIYAATIDGVWRSENGGNNWSPIGLQTIMLQVVAIDPYNPQTIYAGKLMGEPTEENIWRSKDGGASWLGLSGIPGPVSSIALDQQTPGTIYAGGPGCLSMSTDSGDTWSDFAQGLPTPDSPSLNVQALVIDYGNPQTIYAGLQWGGGVYKRTNGATAWVPVSNGLTNKDVQALIIHPSDATTLYAGTFYEGGIFKTTTGGSSWSEANVGLTAAYTWSLVVDPVNSATVYAGTSAGIFKSIDGGNSWSGISRGQVRGSVQDVVLDPSNPEIIYTAGGGIFKSDNGGNSWNQVLKFEWLQSPRVEALAIDPMNSLTIYAGTVMGEGGGIFKSTDGGGNWNLINSTLTDVWALVIDPNNSQIIYVGTGQEGVFKSLDGGDTFSSSSEGLTVTEIMSLAIDPVNPGTIYAGTQGFGKPYPSIYKSTNGGTNWFPLQNGPSGTEVRGLAIDPQNHLTIYAGIGMGLFKSPDGGETTWTQEGLTELITALSIDPQNPQMVYAGTPNRGVFKPIEVVSKIAGRVTDASGNGIGNVDVNIMDLNNNRIYVAHTSGDGSYTVDVKAGSWKVDFSPWATGGYYLDEWYNNRMSFDDADIVTVIAGQTTPNIDAQLEVGGKIAGRVTDTSGNGIANIHVGASSLNNYPNLGTDTGSDGNYTLRVWAGDWKVNFSSWSNPGYYLEEWFNDKRSINEADIVTVVAGQTTPNIHAQLEAVGKIAGRVTDTLGNGIGNVAVNVMDLNNNWMYGTSTSGDGSYSVDVRAGSWKVDFSPWATGGYYLDEWYNNRMSFDEADIVTVIAGQTTSNINALLEIVGGISGRVTDSLGNGFGNIWINVIDLSGNWITGTNSDNDGNYLLVVGEGEYKVQFTPPLEAGNYAVEWYDNKSDVSLANPVEVFRGQTTSGINAQIGPNPKLQTSQIVVADGELYAFFVVYPGFRNLLQSATLTGPNGFSYNFDLENDSLNWLSECRYLRGWDHIFSGQVNYGEYTLTLTFYDGSMEKYIKNLQQATIDPVDESTISVTINSDGGASLSWVLPSSNLNKYYQVRVRNIEGNTEYYSSPPMLDKNTLNVPALGLRCLEKGQTYKWLVRVFDVLPGISNWGLSILNTMKNSYKEFVYSPELSSQRTTTYMAMSWNDRLGIGFDVRPGSRDDITTATVTGPNNFSYTFDLEKDFVDISTDVRINRLWWKEFDTPIGFGDYTLQIEFSDDHIDIPPPKKTLQNVPVTPVDSGTMRSTIYPNGLIIFEWSLPQGVENQMYEVRIRSVDGLKEYYSSYRLLDFNAIYFGPGGLEHCKTYQWFVQAYDPGNNTMKQSNSLTFFYNPFSMNYNSLTVTKTGLGSGTIKSSTGGINCGSYCSDTYVTGMPVTLTATPDEGSIFAGWSGSCSGSGPCTVTMDMIRTVIAVFDLITPAGANIVVHPVDPDTLTTPVTITFENVTNAGATYLNISQNGAPPPAGFKLGNPPTYYNITTTAAYSGSIQICINYSGISFGNESNLRLFHLEGGVWVDCTVSLNTTNKIICANVTSLSLFAIFERIDFIPPEVNITAKPSILWPPNHKMVNVTVNGSASDQLSGIASISFKVTDEYGKVEPTISKFGDVIQLEAWREGNDPDGRIYTISVTATDKAGNQATASTTVICPHDQGGK